ncbi:MAG: DUF2255 family protein [Actinobacteria bacterium]|nr:DUF2255 family protein [Actinomycetota bacterium]
MERLANAPEIEVSSLREDGALTKPAAIWTVRVGDELYVRSARGEAGGWIKAAEQRHEGRIEDDSNGVDVVFDDAPHHLDAEIDAAFRAKYGTLSGPLDSITADAAGANTIRLVPR